MTSLKLPPPFLATALPTVWGRSPQLRSCGEAAGVWAEPERGYYGGFILAAKPPGALGSADSDQSVEDFHNFFSRMDTECDVDRSAGRGFNLSALYALLMIVLW